jgi:hypothetical protein
MVAGVYIVKSGKALRCRVGRSSEFRTSLRVGKGASYLALEHGKDTRAPIFVLYPGDTGAVTLPGQSGLSYLQQRSSG